MNDVTRVIHELNAGDPQAIERLLPLLYDELRKIAAQKLSREKSGQTLQPTALVHEAYVRLLSGEELPQWQNRGHFLGVAAEAMRRIIVESARRKKFLKHGGGAAMVPFDEVANAVAVDQPIDEILEVHDALDGLARASKVSAELVKLRYFAGFELKECAQILEMSESTAKRHWKFARAWLKAKLSKSETGSLFPDA